MKGTKIREKKEPYKGASKWQREGCYERNVIFGKKKEEKVPEQSRGRKKIMGRYPASKKSMHAIEMVTKATTKLAQSPY